MTTTITLLGDTYEKLSFAEKISGLSALEKVKNEEPELSEKVNSLLCFITFSMLPNEIIRHIFSCLTPNELLVCSRVCKLWRGLAYSFGFNLCHARNGVYRSIRSLCVDNRKVTYEGDCIKVGDQLYNLTTLRKAKRSKGSICITSSQRAIALKLSKQIFSSNKPPVFCHYENHRFVYSSNKGREIHVVSTDFKNFREYSWRKNMRTQILIKTCIVGFSLIFLGGITWVMLKMTCDGMHKWTDRKFEIDFKLCVDRFLHKSCIYDTAYSGSKCEPDIIQILSIAPPFKRKTYRRLPSPIEDIASLLIIPAMSLIGKCDFSASENILPYLNYLLHIAIKYAHLMLLFVPMGSMCLLLYQIRDLISLIRHYNRNLPPKRLLGLQTP